jgi:mRNA interferase RelE/StbE
MTYSLAFLDEALKEWRKLDDTTRQQFKAKLEERLENPRVPSARLHGAKDRYKIKLRNAGYRLVYEVRDKQVLVLVVAVGKRERNDVYKPQCGARQIRPRLKLSSRPLRATKLASRGPACPPLTSRESASPRQDGFP